MDIERETKRIHQELAYIGRYQSSISPNLSKWQELEKRKQELRQELKKYPRKADNPKPIQKKAGKSKWGVNTVGNIIYQHYYKKPPTQERLGPKSS